MAPFHAMAELNQNSPGKDANVTNKNTKAGPPNCQIGIAHFFNCQNGYHLGNTNNFDDVSPPPYTFKYYKC